MKTFARHSAFWALLSLLLAPLAVGHASSTNIVVVADRFGREVNGTGITLVDWEGYIANPAIKYTVKAPSTRVILISSEPRLYFNLPSWNGVEGTGKELDFNGTSSQAEFYISIFPDRDGLDEVHSLTIEYLDLNGNWHTQTIDVHVIDQDVSSRALDFDITLDFSQDQTVLFNDSVVRQTVQQAADDWAHFIDDMDLDQVSSGQEESWIWDTRGYSHGGKPIRNKMNYTGFLLYAYGVRVVSGGQPSLWSYQSVNGVSLPLRRSGNLSIDTSGNYNTLGWMTSLPDEEWWKATNFGDVQNDLYSIVLHEIGHALVFNPGYDEFDKFKELGYVKDPAVKNYYDSYPAIDRFDHLPETIDPASRRGVFGNEYGEELEIVPVQMPLGRWLITKGHLLVAQAIGYTLRETSPFTPLSITSAPLPEGTSGAPYSYTANISGGTPAYYWSIESGTLPEGLSIASFTGTISGTPRQHGTFNFTISVSDYDETTSSVTRTLTLTIREGETEPLADSEPSSESQAWLMPEPSEVEFYADDPAWKTFTVHTNLDSVLVRANPSGSDLAIEVAGGQQVPTRDYCPAEGNDRPTRGRRDGYSLHVKACQAGRTKLLLIDYDTGEVLQQYEVNVKIIDNDSAGEPQAWLMPDPSEVEFYADDPAWKTFTVHTNLDSVLVRANPSGSDPAIEVAGGQQVPTRAYCPAEGNDQPTRGRRDGWSLHVKACQVGRTKILLIDYDTDAVLQQYEVNVEAYTSASATTRLNPSYPNPFNSETVLSYTLPTASDIRLEVFTLNGQRVAVLHEGFQAAGYHTIAMDASDLASGVYLYRLTTPEGRFAQKFTLLR